MLRPIYATLVRLHPRDFRQAFGGEMLWIFDEAASTDTAGSIAMLGDAATSLLRQWIIGQAVWKFPAALLGGMLYFMLAGSLLVPHNIRHFEAHVDFGLSPIAWPDQPGR